MAQAWPNSRFVGFDFSAEAIDAARAEAAAMELTNARFEVSDVPAWSGDERFDLVTTFDAVHDQADPAGFLAVAQAMLRPGGRYLCVDIGASSDVSENIDHPMGPMMYAISLFHCMTVSLALGGAGLGTMWGEERALQMLDDAGFANVEIAKVAGDPFNNYYVCSKLV
jgi:2-polyprenyl-3-methyl-5-hydroxy-6-metoxy-1,4-benzoquinol methylase